MLLTYHFSSKDDAGKKVFHFIVHILIDGKHDIFMLLNFTIAVMMALKITLEIWYVWSETGNSSTVIWLLQLKIELLKINIRCFVGSTFLIMTLVISLASALSSSFGFFRIAPLEEYNGSSSEITPWIMFNGECT